MESERAISPDAQITSIGMDESSLKKRHKLYVTVMSDLSDPQRPRVMAMMKGRDREAAEKCLAMLSPQQRQAVRSHRTDMSAVYPLVCSEQLPNSQLVLDRFHVAKQLGELVDRVRKPSSTQRLLSATPSSAARITAPSSAGTGCLVRWQ